MSLFFDLRIPYFESGGSPAPELKARKDARLRAVVMAMELGYAGVAYELCFRGVLSERDRCKIPLFPLSSLLAAAPALHSTVSFHRNLLGSPLSSPFRQYTRLTVLVDSLPSIASLNAGNPLLRSYDIVAARPLNQTAFEQACQTSEVDLISIDFSQKLPFRLKLPMIEAAVKRGVYFEISYADLILDVHRRQMLSEAKLLVDWARGRNIIISSAAPNANAVRGPYDIINLSVVLLGFSMEKAKAAISKNCRLLLENALRKKHFYKEAIRIERIPDVQADNKSGWFGYWNDWDPISSGENDLPPLDDIAKFFSAVSNPPKSSAIDFKSAVDDCMQLRSCVSDVKIDAHLPGDDSSNLPPEKPSSSHVADEFPSVTDETYQQPNIVQFPLVDNPSMATGPLEHQCESEHILAAKSDMETVMVNAEELGIAVASRDDIFATEGYLLSQDTNLFKNTKPSIPCNEVGESFDEPDAILISDEKQNDDMDLEAPVSDQSSDKISPDDVEECIIVPLENYSATVQVEKRIKDREQNNSTIDIALQPGKVVKSAISSEGQVIPEDAFDRMEEQCAIPSSDQVMPEDAPKKTEELSAISSSDHVITADASKKTEEMREEGLLAEKDALVLEVIARIENQKQSLTAANSDDNLPRKLKSGKGRQKEKMLHPVYPLPFKTLFKPLPSKKRVSQLRRTAKHT